MRAWILWLALLCLPALGLKTAYMSFDHPEGWRCELVQGVWICQSTLDTDRREAVVLSIATLATEWDTIDNYLNYLKQPRPTRDADDKEIMSTVSYARIRNINGTNWVDSLQHNSELPGFWTRYLATVQSTPKAQLAILATYIVSDERYESMAPQFERMVTTLRPNTEFDLNIPSQQGDGPIPGSARLGPNTKDLIAERLGIRKKVAVEETRGEDPNSTLLIIALLAVALGIVYAVRLRRRKLVNKGGQETRSPNDTSMP